MGLRTKIELGVAALLAAILVVCYAQGRQIARLRAERNRYEDNTSTLLSDIERYKVRDSLSAARVQALELTKKEYERYKAEDAQLVKELIGKNRDLSAINQAQTATIIELRARAKDTTVIRDTVPVGAVSVKCGDAWYHFEGVLCEGAFTGNLYNRDSLVVVESVKYKRFLFWRTKRVRNRRLDVVSKNPHTTISDVECVIIRK